MKTLSINLSGEPKIIAIIPDMEVEDTLNAIRRAFMDLSVEVTETTEADSVTPV